MSSSPNSQRNKLPEANDGFIDVVQLLATVTTRFKLAVDQQINDLLNNESSLEREEAEKH